MLSKPENKKLKTDNATTSTETLNEASPLAVSPKRVLRSWLKELGLNAQEKNIETNPELEIFDAIALVEQLKKYDIGYTTDKVTSQNVQDTPYPFILILSTGESELYRRRNNDLQQFDFSDNKWVKRELSQLDTTAIVVFIERLPSKQLNVRAFAKEVSKRSKWYRPVFFLSLLISITGLSIPLFTMAVYDRVIGAQNSEALFPIAIGAALAVFIYLICQLYRSYILTSVGNRFARDLTNLTFHRLMSMPLMLLHRVGMVNHMNRMKNAEKIRSILIGPTGTGLIDLPFTLVVLLVIALLSGWLVMVPICMLVLNYLVMKLITKYTNNALPMIANDYQDTMIELAKNVLLLKSGGRVYGWVKGLQRMNQENSRQNFLFAKRNGLTAAVGQALSMLTALTTIFVGIFLVLNQSISPGALIACVMLIWRITGPAQMVFSSSLKFTMMGSAMRQFDSFMMVNTENNELRLDIPNVNELPSISVKQLTLRYNAEAQPALSGISFDIEPGEVVAVIGPNGCGKSSMLLSLLGVLEPQGGYITVNGKNLRQYDPQVFRHWVSYSPAETNLVAGSLADNVRRAKPEATDEEILNALLKAGGQALLHSIDNDINAPFFSEYNILMHSIDSSVISLARVILKDASYWLMDEPLSSCPAVTKNNFEQLIQNMKGNKTIVFTTHDPYLIAMADKVVVLDKGNLVYAGPVIKPEAAPEMEIINGPA
ncbi:ATP-binding cassette domain-containing protein [Psychromonas sp. RZ22]|uniref:peptidase domain-containing ABC transporter n=1 Tax=Psychromonas algarum TaxID=2555643 RepID=UPI0010672EB2|nr:ATP-binding cassette domain-containing protein [Psychromonas sp. RZ22]TEW53208.1 ATP-binding cassette domain-containing protein [Psychromonas sp. RZ22]